MGRDTYQFRDRVQQKEREKQLNPIWRGVGCILIVLLAVGGYAFAGWFLVANQQNAWIYLPYELYYPPFLPDSVPAGLLLRLAVGLIFMILGFGILSFVYAILFPIQPGETDVPLERRRRSSKWRSRRR